MQHIKSYFYVGSKHSLLYCCTTTALNTHCRLLPHSSLWGVTFQHCDGVVYQRPGLCGPRWQHSTTDTMQILPEPMQLCVWGYNTGCNVQTVQGRLVVLIAWCGSYICLCLKLLYQFWWSLVSKGYTEIYSVILMWCLLVQYDLCFTLCSTHGLIQNCSEMAHCTKHYHVVWNRNVSLLLTCSILTSRWNGMRNILCICTF